jgi:hypothetical protein
MKKFLNAMAIAAMVGASATVASAAPINPLNDRSPQIAIAPGSDGPASDLQVLVNTIFGNTNTNVTTDQSTAGMWAVPGAPANVFSPILRFEYGGQNTTQVFGIWFGTDTGSIFHWDIFTGAATGQNNGSATSATLQLDGDGTLQVGSTAPRVAARSPACSTRESRTASASISTGSVMETVSTRSTS